MTSIWGVVVSQPCSENRALLHLQRQGYECYLPKILQRRVQRHKTVLVEQPLFNRYLFIKIVSQWRSIFGTRGVSHLLLNGEKPAFVPEIEIVKLKSREKDGFVQLPEKSQERFTLGQKLKIPRGKFASLSGIYQGMSKRQREVVLLDLLGREVRVELAAGDI